MAGADYLHCVVCERKTIYDAELNYDAATDGEYGSLHDIATICKECSKTHSLQVANHPCAERIADFLDD